MTTADIPPEENRSPLRGRSNLGRATLAMAGGTFAARVTGFARLAMLATVLGVHSGIAEAYNLANTTPNIIYDLIVGGILASTVVPVFVHRTKAEPAENAWRDISAVMTVTGALLGVVSVLFALAAPAVVGMYNLGTSHAAVSLQEHVATELLRLFALQVFFYGAIALVTAALNAHQRFGAPGFAPVINNVVVIAVFGIAAIAYPTHDLVAVDRHYGLLLLIGAGTTAGVGAQFLALLPSLRGIGARIRWNFEPRNPAVLAILRVSSWTVAVVVANSLALTVVLSLAHTLDATGGATAWTYAYMFFQLPFGIVVVSYMSSHQPELTKAWVGKDTERFRATFTKGLRAVTIAMIPAAAGYVVLGGPIVKLVLAHGAAAHSGTAGTGELLGAMALALPGFSAYLFTVITWQAMQNTKAVFGFYMLENGVKLAFSFLLFRPMGLAGLGVAYAVAYTLAAVVAAHRLTNMGLGMLPGMMRTAMVRVSVPTVAMAASVVAVTSLMHPSGTFGYAVEVGIGLVTGVGVFGGVAVAGMLLKERLGR